MYLSLNQIQELSLHPEEGILGVHLKVLKSHGDERGFFREIFRETEPLFSGGHFAQWSHSFMQKDVVKAWHYHHIQHDWWYVPVGQIATCLIDFRQESPTYKRKLLFKIGERARYGEDTCELCVCIPPGVLHGCRVLSDSAHLFYITSKIYNPEDEGRYPYNDPNVPHNWGDAAIVVENDKRRFVPSSPRIQL